MKSSFFLAGVPVGSPHPIRILGVINVSPESFYRSSVKTRERDIVRQAERMEKEGADFIDVGAMSTAPYLLTQISEEEEARRIVRAVKIIRRACSLPISIDTTRARPAAAGLDAGARILNDVTGFHGDPELPRVARRAGGVILMAHPVAWKRGGKPADPIRTTRLLLTSSLTIARRNGIPFSKIVLDPGIGFFRNAGLPWWRWDVEILSKLKKLASLPAPLLVGVSRKSFLGHLLNGAPPDQRLEGSLAATAIAILNGASLLRTHDVAATRKAGQISISIREMKLFSK